MLVRPPRLRRMNGVKPGYQFAHSKFLSRLLAMLPRVAPDARLNNLQHFSLRNAVFWVGAVLKVWLFRTRSIIRAEEQLLGAFRRTSSQLHTPQFTGDVVHDGYCTPLRMEAA